MPTAPLSPDEYGLVWLFVAAWVPRNKLAVQRSIDELSGKICEKRRRRRGGGGRLWKATYTLTATMVS